MESMFECIVYTVIEMDMHLSHDASLDVILWSLHTQAGVYKKVVGGNYGLGSKEFAPSHSVQPSVLDGLSHGFHWTLCHHLFKTATFNVDFFEHALNMLGTTQNPFAGESSHLLFQNSKSEK